MSRHRSPPGRFEFIEELTSSGRDRDESHQQVELNEPRCLVKKPRRARGRGDCRGR
jgi:hypothetical protein